MLKCLKRASISNKIESSYLIVYWSGKRFVIFLNLLLYFILNIRKSLCKIFFLLKRLSFSFSVLTQLFNLDTQGKCLVYKEKFNVRSCPIVAFFSCTSLTSRNLKTTCFLYTTAVSADLITFTDFGIFFCGLIFHSFSFSFWFSSNLWTIATCAAWTTYIFYT